jgi:hypothetical protein
MPILHADFLTFGRVQNLLASLNPGCFLPTPFLTDNLKSLQQIIALSWISQKFWGILGPAANLLATCEVAPSTPPHFELSGPGLQREVPFGLQSAIPFSANPVGRHQFHPPRGPTLGIYCFANRQRPRRDHGRQIRQIVHTQSSWNHVGELVAADRRLHHVLPCDWRVSASAFAYAGW